MKGLYHTQPDVPDADSPAAIAARATGILADEGPVGYASRMPSLLSGRRRPEVIAVIAVAALVVVLAAFRSALGVSFYDDSHYVTVSLRLAQGARPFADEMTMQSLGFLPGAAFTWLWTHLVGMTGLVLASRLFYVTLATAVAVLSSYQLSRSFRPAVAALAVSVPLLCPPFNLLAPGYNLMTTLGLLAATALAHRAWMQHDRLAAAGAGFALFFSSATYPPMVIACCVFMIAFAFLARDRRLTIAIGLAFAISGVLFLSAVSTVATLSDFQRALAYSSANVIRFGSPLDKLSRGLLVAYHSLSVAALWPMWICAALASVPRLPKRLRGLLLLAIAPLAAVQGYQAVHAHLRTFGITASAWLITFTLAALIPIAVWAINDRRREVRGLLATALPVSTVAFVTVLYATDAGWLRAVPVIGLVPLSVAVLAGWGSALDELLGGSLLAVGALTAVTIAFAMLYVTSIDDGYPRTMTAVMDHGAYAGMRMTSSRLHELLVLEAAGHRWVRPDDRVTFYGERQGYLLTGGRIYTNAVWLYISPSDSFALDYFRQHSGLPDVIFADEHGMRMHKQGNYQLTAPGNPLVAVLIADYRLVQHVDDFGVWVRRLGPPTVRPVAGQRFLQ